MFLVFVLPNLYDKHKTKTPTKVVLSYNDVPTHFKCVISCLQWRIRLYTWVFWLQFRSNIRKRNLSTCINVFWDLLVWPLYWITMYVMTYCVYPGPRPQATRVWTGIKNRPIFYTKTSISIYTWMLNSVQNYNGPEDKISCPYL